MTIGENEENGRDRDFWILQELNSWAAVKGPILDLRLKKKTSRWVYQWLFSFGKGAKQNGEKYGVLPYPYGLFPENMLPLFFFGKKTTSTNGYIWVLEWFYMITEQILFPPGHGTFLTFPPYQWWSQIKWWWWRGKRSVGEWKLYQPKHPKYPFIAPPDSV